MNIMNLYEPILVKLYLIHIKYQLLNLTINLLVEWRYPQLEFLLSSAVLAH